MGCFQMKDFDNHEEVHFFCDSETKLRVIIALHDTTLGPALGGCRLWSYASDDDALADVLRLSQGMTYKNALAGLPNGGGKSVVLKPPSGELNEAMLRKLGKMIHSLQGKYISAEDVGISPSNISVIREETPHVVGVPGKSGDPSPHTAYGTFVGIKAASAFAFGTEDLSTLSVAVQGVGRVGYHLCTLLHEAGARLVICDVNNKVAQQAAHDFSARLVSENEIYSQDVDIYCPCALGGTVNDTTLPLFKAKIIAGSANNQLAEARHGDELRNRSILYAPDYVINAGGVINVSYEQHYDSEMSHRKITNIANTLSTIFDRSQFTRSATHRIADAMAQEVIRTKKP